MFYPFDPFSNVSFFLPSFLPFLSQQLCLPSHDSFFLTLHPRHQFISPTHTSSSFPPRSPRPPASPHMTHVAGASALSALSIPQQHQEARGRGDGIERWKKEARGTRRAIPVCLVQCLARLPPPWPPPPPPSLPNPLNLAASTLGRL